MNVNDYLEHVYLGPQPPCWQLVSEVYMAELGQTVKEFRTINNSVRSIASAFRIALHKGAHGFEQVAAPADFAVVLLGKSVEIGLHHCGIWFDGKLLHALESGNYYEEMSAIGDRYALVEHWAKAP